MKCDSRAFDALPSSWIKTKESLKYEQWKTHELGHTPWLAALSGAERRGGASKWD
jgi:hypothetical protein